MPNRGFVWTHPDDEANALVEALYKLRAPQDVLTRAERLQQWTKYSTSALARIHTISGGGEWCPTEIARMERLVATAPTEAAKFKRLMTDD